MKNYLSVANGGSLNGGLNGTFTHPRALTSSSESNILNAQERYGKPFRNGSTVNLHPYEPSAYQISGSSDRLSVNSFNTTTTVPAGHNLRYVSPDFIAWCMLPHYIYIYIYIYITVLTFH